MFVLVGFKYNHCKVKNKFRCKVNIQFKKIKFNFIDSNQLKLKKFYLKLK